MNDYDFQLSLSELPFLSDHQIQGKFIIPGVFLIHKVDSILKDLLPSFSGMTYSHLQFLQKIPFNPQKSSLSFSLRIESVTHEFSQVNLLQKIQIGRLLRYKEIFKLQICPSSIPLLSIPSLPFISSLSSFIQQVPQKEIYPSIINLGPSFQVIKSLSFHPHNSIRGSIAPREYFLLREGGLQLAFYWGLKYDGSNLLPRGIDELRIFHQADFLPFTSFTCHVTFREENAQEMIFDAFYFDQKEKLCEIHQGLRMWKSKRDVKIQ